jgi:hypothetical protein
LRKINDKEKKANKECCSNLKKCLEILCSNIKKKHRYEIFEKSNELFLLKKKSELKIEQEKIEKMQQAYEVNKRVVEKYDELSEEALKSLIILKCDLEKLPCVEMKIPFFCSKIGELKLRGKSFRDFEHRINHEIINIRCAISGKLKSSQYFEILDEAGIMFNPIETAIRNRLLKIAVELIELRKNVNILKSKAKLKKFECNAIFEIEKILFKLKEISQNVITNRREYELYFVHISCTQTRFKNCKKSIKIAESEKEILQFRIKLLKTNIERLNLEYRSIFLKFQSNRARRKALFVLFKKKLENNLIKFFSELNFKIEILKNSQSILESKQLSIGREENLNFLIMDNERKSFDDSITIKNEFYDLITMKYIDIRCFNESVENVEVEENEDFLGSVYAEDLARFIIEHILAGEKINSLQKKIMFYMFNFIKNLNLAKDVASFLINFMIMVGQSETEEEISKKLISLKEEFEKKFFFVDFCEFMNKIFNYLAEFFGNLVSLNIIS